MPASEPDTPAAQAVPDANSSEHVKSETDASAAEEAPPRTVEEMAKRSLNKSKKNLEEAGQSVEKAGSSVSDAAKKTWNCLTSLFSKC